MKKISLSGDAARGALARVPRGLLLVIAIVVVLAVGAALVANQWLGGRGAQTGTAWNEAYRQMAQTLSRGIAVELAQYQAAIAAIAADPRVVEALDSGAAPRRAELARALQPQLPGVLALRLLPPDLRAADMSAQPPLTYASMSMLRRARERGTAPPAEVHLTGTEDEHMVFLAPVSSSAADQTDAIRGFVHLSVDPDILRVALSNGAPDDVYAELRQAPSVGLASVGQRPAAGAPAISLPVKGTAFSVVFMAEGHVTPPGDTGISFTVPLIAVVLVAGALVLWQRFRPAVRIGAVGDGAVVYQGAIRAILDGAHPGLEVLLPRARGAGGGRTEVDIDELERAGGEDVTTLAATPPPVDEDPTVPRPGDAPPAAEPVPVPAREPLPASIFRSYDIRGIVGDTLTEDGVYQIGRALGAEAEARAQNTVVVARDGRHSSEALMQALTKGLLESGREVLDIGLTPTPVLYFATHFLDARSGVMITGSHNPPEYNGLKIVLDRETLSGEAIQAIRRRVEEQDFFDGTGALQSTDIVAEYIRRISEEIPVTLGNELKVVVDCGNAVPGLVAPDILRAIGHDVIELHCEVDGDFPNHHPDPSQPENLAALIDTVIEEGADLGLAFDGDGDRLGVVDGEGRVIAPDRQMILFARDILARNPGAKIIYDVKCSRRLPADIAAHGGEAIMARTGHSLIKARMQETGALLAGEMSGHIFFKDRWYGFDDAIYSAARLLEIIVNSAQSPTELFATIPTGVATPELRLPMSEERHAPFMQQVLEAGAFDDAEISTLDGLRVDLPDAWGLVRPSNTTPCLVLRFEGDDEAALAAIQQRFRTLLTGIDASLELPF